MVDLSVVRLNLIAAFDEQLLQTSLPFIDLDVEGFFAVSLGEHQWLDGFLSAELLLQIVEKDEKQRQGGEALLAVYDGLHAVLATDDKWPEEIIVVMLDVYAGIPLRINVEKGRGQVGDELLDVLPLPTVFALEVINCVFLFVQQLEDAAVIGIDFVVIFTHCCFCNGIIERDIDLDQKGANAKVPKWVSLTKLTGVAVTCLSWINVRLGRLTFSINGSWLADSCHFCR